MPLSRHGGVPRKISEREGLLSSCTPYELALDIAKTVQEPAVVHITTLEPVVATQKDRLFVRAVNTRLDFKPHRNDLLYLVACLASVGAGTTHLGASIYSSVTNILPCLSQAL